MNAMPNHSDQGVIGLVSTDWLMDRLPDRQIMIIDCQPNVHDYIQEHIPGALYLNENVFRTHTGAHPARWVPAPVIRPILAGSGINESVPVVVYTGVGVNKGWGDGLAQTMVAYSLARYGHRCVYVLDGGIDQWKREGRPLSQEFPVARPAEFEMELRQDYYIEHDEFLKIKDASDVLLLDARPAAFYEGQGCWSKPGHIPGAVSLPWASLMDDNNKALLKPREEIGTILEDKGASKDKTIICSCGTGREATNEFLLFRFYLNYPRVRIHEGAFTEWVSYPENPTVTGPSPR